MRAKAGDKTGRDLVRCFMDDYDITEIAYEADDVEGWADVYLRGTNGRIIQAPRDGGFTDKLTTRLKGKIRFEMRPKP